MLSDTNAFRKKFGSGALTIDQDLAKQAQAYANWLAQPEHQNQASWKHGYIDSAGTRGPSGGGLPEVLTNGSTWAGVDAKYTGSKAFGQNLSKFSGQESSNDSAIASFVVSGADGWGGECIRCNPSGANPCPMVPDAKKETGHFTQQIWKGTNQMGCGKATSSSGETYVACNYYPPGNNRTGDDFENNLPVHSSLAKICSAKYPLTG